MVYFISDVHLGLFSREIDKKKEDTLLQLLAKIAGDAECLYIVGDLFDYWFEYRSVIPKYYYRTLTALHDMSHKGIKIEYIMGNHDFGHRDFFKKEMNIIVHRGDIEAEIAGKNFYITHGDGKSNKDTGYKILKKILRNRLAQALFFIIHPDVGIWLASSSSKKSRRYTEAKDYSKHDGMVEFAKQKAEEGFDFIIMGHRHKSELLDLGNAFFVDIGDWLNEPTFGMFDGSELKLLKVREFLSE